MAGAAACCRLGAHVWMWSHLVPVTGRPIDKPIDSHVTAMSPAGCHRFVYRFVYRC